jgi:hypothetical protein
LRNNIEQISTKPGQHLQFKEIGNRCNQNFQAGFKAHPLGYKGVNLGISTVAQSKVRIRAKARMLAKGHVLARLARLPQPSID